MSIHAAVMQWYLVHTKPKQENWAKQNLEQQGYRCYLPLSHDEKLHQGKITVASTPLFPRYLFIQLGQDTTDKSWIPIRSTKGVNRLVFFGASPAKVDDYLIENLRAQECHQHQHPEKLYYSGERVELVDGAFAGFEGVYQMTDGEQRAMVLLELLSKPVTLRISPAKLRKVS